MRSGVPIGVVLGALASLLAALAYDVFRLPFVFGRSWQGAEKGPFNFFRLLRAFSPPFLTGRAGGASIPCPGASLFSAATPELTRALRNFVRLPKK